MWALKCKYSNPIMSVVLPAISDITRSDFSLQFHGKNRPPSHCLCLQLRSTDQSPRHPEWRNRPVVGLAFAGESVTITAVIRPRTTSSREDIRKVLNALRIASGADSFLTNAHRFTPASAYLNRFTPSCLSICHNECVHRLETEQFERLFPGIPLITFRSDLVFGRLRIYGNFVGSCVRRGERSAPLFFQKSTFFVNVALKSYQRS